MSSKSYLKIAIEKFIRENSIWVTFYSNWYVGITNDPDRRRPEHGNPSIWRSWQANSVEEARQIEVHFLDLGLNGDTGGGIDADYVYVYKL